MDRRRKAAAALLLITLLAIAALAGGCGKSEETRSASPSVSAPDEPWKDSSAPDEEVTVQVFFIKGESVSSVTRRAAKAGPEAALQELLKGPDEEEARQDNGTAIPEGTRLLSFSVTDGKAVADFSRELRSYGGGSAIIQAIIQQIKDTVTSNDPSIVSVEITVEGVGADEALQP